jgi:pimeloyl-ACP methyl ester carboxylesterase
VTARWLVPLVLLAASSAARADGPKDNIPDNVRRIPPPGIKVPDADRQELQVGVDNLGREIEELRTALKGKPALLELLPDVQVYHKTVDWALRHDEFYKESEIAVAKGLLKQGLERGRLLKEGQAPWETATGLVVRGYVSKIDGSVQPYGLVVPASYQPGWPYRHRLDLWCHGRGETLTELAFIDGRQKSPGEFTPPHAFVLHLYGRYCNANKFAGEVDCFEAMEHVQKHYPIDENRRVIRGFSMGGAACWHLAVHYPSVWAAAAPGAGFSETPDFLKVFQDEKVQPADYEKKLWHVYDCIDYATNLFNVPTVAYSGEIDKQKQAADMMAKALEGTGMTLTHIIGPKTGHAYHPEAKKEINRRIDSIVTRGRNSVPDSVDFTTWTLRYNECFWVRLDGMEEEWKRARVDGYIGGEFITLDTQNVSALTLSIPPGYGPANPLREGFRIQMDGAGRKTALRCLPTTDRSLEVHLRKVDGNWQIVPSPDDDTLRKRHGLQGPIDDAFMDNFLMVRPTGKPLNENVGAWAKTEMDHAVEHWRRQFRGEARVRNDDAVSDEDIAGSNLVLWGDPGSNKVLAKIADRLPIRWEAEGVRVGDKTYSADTHVPALIYPNPLNPKRYVVLNSGFTFREYDYLNNARQVPRLPDWAVIDVSVPPSSRAPGGIVAADFFGERWELKPAAKE